jgi:hypothetical protein
MNDLSKAWPRRQQQSYRVEVQDTEVVIYCEHSGDAYRNARSLGLRQHQVVFIFCGRQLVGTVIP